MSKAKPTAATTQIVRCNGLIAIARVPVSPAGTE